MPLKLLSTLLALLLLTTPARSQDKSSKISDFSDDEAKAIARALVELEGCRSTVAALKDTIGAKDTHIKALESALAATEAAMAKWKEAAEARGEANATDAALQKSYEASLKAYTLELERTRKERDDARRSRWYWAAGGVVLGVVFVLAARNGP